MIDAVQETISGLAEVGEPVLLRRAGQPDLTVQAFVVGYQPQEMLGGIVQGDRRAIMSNAEIEAAGWPGPPLKGDQLVVRHRTTSVQACNTLVLGSSVVRHELQLRGG